MNEQWKISGDMILNCSCTVFCPCVVSLGEHPPTEGNCQAWMGLISKTASIPKRRSQG